MTKSILHAIKKFLRISVIVLLTTGSVANASAQSGDCVESCSSQINLSLDASGYALIDPTMVWEGVYNNDCFPLMDAIVVEIEGSTPVTQDMTHNGHSASITSARVDCSLTGQMVEYNLIKHYTDGTTNSCWGNILIEDKKLPNIVCTDLYVYCNDDVDPYELVEDYDKAIPEAFDNCEISELTFEDTIEEYECSEGDYLKKITRTWTATDPSNNQKTCTQNIFVKKANGNEIQFPIDLNDIAGSSLSCDNPNLDPSNTGYPTLYGKEVMDHELCKFSIQYEDLQIDVCGGSFKILREWIAYDWCSNDIFTHTQVIKVLDQVAPTIECPQIPDVGTSSNSCTGNLILPEAIISDVCSDFTVTTQTPNGTINGNGGMVVGLGLGEHQIIYTATDDCGNIGACTTYVSIIDNIAPIAVCDEHTMISLTTDGTAIAYAATFDDGSQDNCGIVDYKVRRMDNPDCPGNDGTPFGDFVPFTCCDLGSVILVELKVTDAAGNSNSCMVEVELEDKIDPVIFCPSDKTLECQSDYTDLNLTGQATATDNCSTSNIDYEDIEIDINSCGVGTVTRVWTARDGEGNTASCFQTIHLINENIFDEDDFIFPLDYDTDQCGGGDLSPDNLSTPYNYPVITDDACDQVAVTYEDQVLQIAPPACYKILRKWIIIDWCQYDPNYVGENGETPGRWEHVQVIKVTDNTAPEIINCPGNLFINSEDEDCNVGYVGLTIDATDCSNFLEYSYQIDADNDGSIEMAGTGNDASGMYEFGFYSITFTVADGCGNSSSCYFEFTVQDGKKPTPVCLNGLSTDIMPTAGSVTIWASDFESGSSYDNCSAHESLRYSFSSNVDDIYKTLTCDDLGDQPIEFWVTDEKGNQDFCSTYINVQDNNGACVAPTAIIEGGVENELGEEVEDVTIEITGSNSLPIVTGASGSFIFPEVPTGNTYTITPQKDMNYLNGVSTYDLILISKHILGSELFTSPYKIIAADANKSNTVTTLDIVHLRSLILQNTLALPLNNSWRFVDANYVFSNPNNPLAENFPEVVSIDNLTADQATNFIAIKIGDVNENASPNNLLGVETRNNVATLSIDVVDQIAEIDQILTVDFKAKDFVEMMGFQFTLSFDADALDFEDVKTKMEGLSENNFGLTLIEEGKITVSWNDDASLTLKDDTILFSLIFKAKAKSILSGILQISSAPTIAEAYSKTNTSALGTSDVMDIQLTFNGQADETSWNQLLQNRPNPVRGATIIPFKLVKDEEVTLKLIDLNGKVLRVVRGAYNKGYNEISLTNLDGNGILYYHLETSSTTLVKKMILIQK